MFELRTEITLDWSMCQKQQRRSVHQHRMCYDLQYIWAQRKPVYRFFADKYFVEKGQLNEIEKKNNNTPTNLEVKIA